MAKDRQEKRWTTEKMDDGRLSLVSRPSTSIEKYLLCGGYDAYLPVGSEPRRVHSHKPNVVYGLPGTSCEHRA
jgi:hypothetical protein